MMLSRHPVLCSQARSYGPIGALNAPVRHLEQGSSVRVTAHSDLGQVRLDGAGWRTESQAGKNRETAVLGGGVASLDVECTVGSVRLDAL